VAFAFFRSINRRLDLLLCGLILTTWSQMMLIRPQMFVDASFVSSAQGSATIDTRSPWAPYKK
jgi:hypothetical protein